MRELRVRVGLVAEPDPVDVPNVDRDVLAVATRVGHDLVYSYIRLEACRTSGINALKASTY